jgi:endonuclease/exonuclease/phosphatase (EEP) superfamily protein YafD
MPRWKKKCAVGDERCSRCDSRIDYVFYSRSEEHLTLKTVQVVDTRDANGVMPSDHRPVLVEFMVQ